MTHQVSLHQVCTLATPYSYLHCECLTTHTHTHTATADYTPVNQVLTFQSNTRDCVDVMTGDDDTLEFSETFQISVISTTSDADVILGDISVATITILNDDSKLC